MIGETIHLGFFFFFSRLVVISQLVTLVVGPTMRGGVIEVIAGRRGGSFSHWKPKLRGRNLAVVGGGGEICLWCSLPLNGELCSCWPGNTHRFTHSFGGGGSAFPLKAKIANQTSISITYTGRAVDCDFNIEWSLEKPRAWRFGFARNEVEFELVIFPECAKHFFTGISAVRAEGRQEQWLPSVSMENWSFSRLLF